MKFFAASLWLVGPLLESLLVSRALLQGWYKKYPMFFCYLACVLVQDLFFLSIYSFRSEYYASIYWYGQFFSLALGAGVTYEIFVLVLRAYPGAGRMARNVLALSLIIGLCKPFVDAWSGGSVLPLNMVELERNLRGVQAFSLLALAGLVAYYRIPIGRNVRGIFAGYGFFVGSSLAALTLGSSVVGEFYRHTWAALQPTCYIVVLLLWCISVWKYEPAPALAGRNKMEQDYQLLTHATRKGVLQARSFLGKAIRP